MTEDEARHVEKMLRLCGLPGVAAADPADPSEDWRIYDRVDADTRRDITDESRRALYTDAQSGSAAPVEPRAVRGFIVPGR
ncbi:hypothetical protein [Streptomyces sp. 8N616]|uniref:hypothetical protein n=1 Tax=Streptomyces sp. 8N616 TaxID=3457414 RepID=UPI003FD525D4